MEIADPVRQAALFPELDLPDPPAGHPYRVRRGDGFVVGCFPGGTFASVSVQAFPPDEVGQRVETVRAVVVEEGFSKAAWLVSEAARPEGLALKLQQFGMTPWNEPMMEPRFRQMALVAAPRRARGGVDARLVGTFEEFVAGQAVASGAFESTDQDRRAFEQHADELWRWQQRFPQFQTFVATIGGEIVGHASAIFGTNAVYLVGGSVREDMRGRGAYAALVRARWDAAEARGTPALTVAAGQMSSPVLEHLGFSTVGFADVLRDTV
jgi:GNAT superfamily N-acetyltransferase